jgi:hypothetical protein
VTSPDYTKVKSGTYNLLLRQSDGALWTYFESNGRIAARLETVEKTPEGYADEAMKGSTGLAFPWPPKMATSPRPSLRPDVEPAAFFFRNCTIYIKITVNGHGYCVWSGVTGRC